MLIAPWSVMRSPRAAGRACPEIAFSFSTGLPERDTGRGIVISWRKALIVFDLGGAGRFRASND